MKIEEINLNDLKEYGRNARTHSSEQIEQLKRSITEFGFTNPVLIDEHNVLIAGHGRCAAARALRMEKVPCIRLNGLSEAQRKALRIADNQLALNAGWDEELLKIELAELQAEDFDLDLLGFSFEEIDKLLHDGAGSGQGENPENPDKEPKGDPLAFVVSIKLNSVQKLESFLNEFKKKIESKYDATISVKS